MDGEVSLRTVVFGEGENICAMCVCMCMFAFMVSHILTVAKKGPHSYITGEIFGNEERILSYSPAVYIRYIATAQPRSISTIFVGTGWSGTGTEKRNKRNI